MSCVDQWLQRFYWGSQIGLFLVAVIAAFAAFIQVRTYKLFELLKFLESPDFRRSRRIVVREIAKRTGEWWNDKEHGEHFEEAASHVCAAYDILGRMIEFDRLERIFPKSGDGAFFRRFWANSIVRTHDVLSSFLAHRRETAPDAYAAFTRLAQAARPYATMGPLTEK